MRHRAGLGISENTDAFVIIISEERGEISIAENGELISGISDQELWFTLNKKFG
jgi:diadenylate cyclase